jgi:ATP-dependent Clp protease ATP-binding subunit ClpA
MIAQELEVSLHMAFVEARQKRHEFITVEHLLLALLDNPTAAEVLRACAANIEELRKALGDFIAAHTPTVAGSEEIDTQPTLGFQRVIQRAILHVQSSGKKEVTGANVLVAIFGEKDSHAVYFLHQQGVTRLDVVNYISHGITKTPQSKDAGKGGEAEQDTAGDEQQTGGALETYTLNLNAQALVGKIDPLIGRERELERVIQTLCRRRKNNPLLVGEAGVGKTAIAEGLARRIVEGPLPGVCARHGRTARWNEVPRRLRATTQGGAEAARGQSKRDPLHRRDTYADRRGRGIGRYARRVQLAQAGALHGSAEVHRSDHLQRVPRRVRKGSRAVAALPEDRRA